jgi:hypothetical protein
MSHKGKIQLILIFAAPADQVEEGDRIFQSHGPWMEATHKRTGDKALLSYNLSKAPELSNPTDSNSAPTGNTLFILSEIYETHAGVVNHFELSQSWQDFPAILKWVEKCKVTGLPAAPIINSLW